MKAKLHFIRQYDCYLVYRGVRNYRRARLFLGRVSKDPLRPVWTNNHEPRTYPTRLAAAKGLL